MRKNLLQLTSQISNLAKSGNLSCARKVFDEMPHRDTIAWNAMITAYSNLDFHREALSLFTSMRFTNLSSDHFTYTSVLSACAALKDAEFGRRIHCLIVTSGCNSTLPVSNALIDMYGKCSNPSDARAVFEEMEIRNEISWCSLLFAYSNAGVLDAAGDVFDDMPMRVVVAWNTVIAGYAKFGEIELCFELFKMMLEDSSRPDQWTLSSIMNACVELCNPGSFIGRMVHAFIVRSGWDSAVEVTNSVLCFYTKFGEEYEVLKAVEAVRVLSGASWNAIIDAYMKIGYTDNAFLVFQHVPEKNLISWTSMITGYMKNGYGECALKFFVSMMRSGVRPDDIAFGGALHACSHMAILSNGSVVHGCIVRSGFLACTYIGNGLVNMYAKCGDIFDSHEAFIDVLDKDLISWNTMMFAYGMHGSCNRALWILNEMLASRVKPDKVTFVGILMTCSHLGLIEEGLAFFESMTSDYGIVPELEHVASVIDMLGRGGKLEKAKEIADRYIATHDMKVKEVLLGCYYSRGKLAMVAGLAEQLQVVKPHDEMSYMMLSNLYCASGEWIQAQALRKLMVDKGVKKTPGCSWIEVNNRVMSFVAGNNTVPDAAAEEVPLMLHFLESETRFPTSIVLR